MLLFFAIFVYREGKKIYKEKKKYFKEFWNLVEFTMIVLVVTSLGVFMSRLMQVNAAVKKIEDNPGKFVSFNKVVQWDNMFVALTSILVLVSCIKSIRLLSYNKTISLLACTLKGSAKPLGAFFIVFLVFFFSFTIFAYIIFVPHLADYKSFITASESVLTLLLGGFDFLEIRAASPILAPLWFLAIMLFGVMYIMNVFLTIIMDTYSTVKDELTENPQEIELVDFMSRKFLYLIGKGDGGKKDLMEKIKADEEAAARVERRKQKKIDKGKSKKKLGKKKYMKMVNTELDEKFAQLDNSLNG